ncbi:MAG: ribonuclease E/G [Rhodobacteraceae bacterium]|nr:ribonuclease E/G [Paracoccaceae bacterium]
MRGRLVALDRLAAREAAALVVDGRLADLLVAPPADAPPGPGAILRGRMGRPVKGLGGAFVDLPGGLTGFLKETAGLAPGRPVLVQVTGWPEPGKALPLTTRLLLRSRHAIATPGAPGLNLARTIRDAGERERLLALAGRAMAGSALGLILRSAAAFAPEDEVAADIARVRRLAEAVAADLAGPPELLLAAPDPGLAAWCDWADPAPDAVDDAPGAFARHGVLEMIDALRHPAAPLPGGASLVVEPTRALVAVDVNTGPDTSPAAALKANIAAARELPRQLRLRGLGGKVVLDPAPLARKDRAQVEGQLRAAFRAEGGDASLAGWTPLGSYELTRRRDRMPLAVLLREAEA